MITPAELKFVKITSTESPYFKEICSLLEKSFIADERREITQNLLASEVYCICAVLYQNTCIGVKSWWEFPDFVFQEHLATSPSLRNQGLGEAIMRKCREIFPTKPLIGECERPVTEIAGRRLNYYKRIGYTINSFSYVQPPYSPQKSPIPLFLISYPRAITEREYYAIKKQVYEKVYGITEEALQALMQPFQNRKYSLAKKSLARLNATDTQDNAYLLQVIAEQAFARDFVTRKLLHTIAPVNKAAFELSSLELESLMSGFRFENQGGEPVALHCGFYRSELLRNQEHVVLVGALYTVQTEKIIGFWILTLSSDEDKRRCCTIEIVKRNRDDKGGVGIGTRLFQDVFDPLCKRLKISTQKLDAHWLGRAFYAQEGFVFDKEVMLFSKGELLSQVAVARNHLREFLTTRKMEVSELGIRQEDKTLKKIGDLNELCEPKDFVNLIHLDHKKIAGLVHGDDGNLSLSQELTVGKAFSLGKYYEEPSIQINPDNIQNSALKHPNYAEHVLTHDALFAWSGIRVLET